MSKFTITLSDEQREQLKQFAHGVQQVVMQAGEAAQDLARRAAKATQEGLQLAVESVVEVSQEVARQGTQYAGEMVKLAMSREYRQSVGQKVEQAISQAASPLPPELQARSIRFRGMFRSTGPELSERQ